MPQMQKPGSVIVTVMVPPGMFCTLSQTKAAAATPLLPGTWDVIALSVYVFAGEQLSVAEAPDHVRAVLL